jgi:hypothetical protein
MNSREKNLIFAVGGLVAVFVLGFGIRSWIVQPLKDIDKRTVVVREKIEKLKTERRNYFAAEDRLKTLTAKTFADTVDEASAKSGEVLTKDIVQSGLEESDFTRLPVGPRKIRGANEIGWNVQGDGPLDKVVNLLFTLAESPHLHRLENLTVAAGDAPGLVRVRFRYLTLVMDPAPEVTRTNLVPRVTLDSSDRRLLDEIARRDILRPYIKRPPPPAPPGQSAPAIAAKPGPPPGPETFRIVSLSEWQGQPEVHVRDITHQKTLRFRAGDALAGGSIVMVDYRPMPLPGNTLLQSFSRVILKIDSDYWAIERGQTLADRRKLATAELPAQLATAK